MQKSAENVVQKQDSESKLDTTVEELESYYIVKAILRNNVEGSRIFYRDAQSYFSVILDDNNRKPICRIYLNGGKKYLGVFDADKKETKHEISSIDEIYKYADGLIAVVLSYGASDVK